MFGLKKLTVEAFARHRMEKSFLRDEQNVFPNDFQASTDEPFEAKFLNDDRL